MRPTPTLQLSSPRRDLPVAPKPNLTVFFQALVNSVRTSDGSQHRMSRYTLCFATVQATEDPESKRSRSTFIRENEEKASEPEMHRFARAPQSNARDLCGLAA